MEINKGEENIEKEIGRLGQQDVFVNAIIPPLMSTRHVPNSFSNRKNFVCLNLIDSS